MFYAELRFDPPEAAILVEAIPNPSLECQLIDHLTKGLCGADRSASEARQRSNVLGLPRLTFGYPRLTFPSFNPVHLRS